MAFEYAGHIWRKGTNSDFWKKVVRHPVETTKAVRKQPSVRRAMLAKAKEQPTCEATGAKKIAVHHDIPASIDDVLADKIKNLTSLHPFIHKILAHPFGFKSYNPNIEQDAADMLAIIERAKRNAIRTKSYKWFEKQKASGVA